MKRIASSILLLLFLYNIIGYYVVFFWEQCEVKEEMKYWITNSTSENNLTEFVFDKKDFYSLQWTEEDEFRYNGNMYDVVKTRVNQNGTITIVCISDKKEKELFTQLEEQTKQNSENSAGRKNEHNPVKIFSDDFLLVNKIISFVTSKESTCSQLLAQSFVSFISETTTPPPKSV